MGPNPFIQLVEGQLVAGRRLRIRVIAPGLRPMELKPKVFAVRPPEEIIWGGSFLGIVYRGDHPIRGDRLRQSHGLRRLDAAA